MESEIASIPEPSPVNEGKNVPDHLIKWLENTKHSKVCIKLIKERDLFGFQKYGQHLMTNDGRSDIEDLRQELGDALQYAMKAKLNGLDLTSTLKIVDTLRLLITTDLN